LKSIFGTLGNVVIPATVDRVGVEVLRLLVDQVEVGHNHAARAIVCVDLQSISPALYEQLLCRYSLAKKIQSKIEVREKQ